VPVDPSYPAERVAYMLEDSGAFRVITDRRLTAELPIPPRCALLVDEPEDEGGHRAPAARRVAGPDQLAYVIYTSGSTGRPKGAMNSHRAIVNRLRWMQEAFRLTAGDRVLQKTPASFDVSVWELFWPLMTGACLVVARPGGHLDPPYLRDEIAARGITTVHFVPSLLQLFLDQPGLAACAGLRRVIVSGEILPRELAGRFHESLGQRGAELHNLYGPTEAAVDVTWWPCPASADSRPVPIGRPIDNTRVVVLDRALQPVAAGVVGELCIGGVQVARGYLSLPGLTAERFIPDPFAGPEEAGGRLYRTGDLVRHRTGSEMEFLGRLDHQVKVRGVRVELGEIEVALAEHPAVREAVVLARGATTETRLAAYVVPVGEAAPAAEELRAHLQARLPETMIPGAWVFLPCLPLSPSGKVDRLALPEPDLAAISTPFVAPRTAAEETLAAIWRDVLRREQVGIHDNFFALGGDSILGIQILSRAAQSGLALTPRQIFRYPTIFALASVAERVEDRISEPDQVMGGVPLTPIQRWFFEQRLLDPHHYNQAVMLLAGETLVPAHLQAAFRRILAHHDAVRLRFTPSKEGWRQESSGIDDLTEEPWHHIDLSGLPAPSQTAEIKRGAARVQASFDLVRGPLLRAALFDTGEAGLPRLLVAAHHMVIDGVSWRILLGDLEDAYRKARNGEPVVLGPKTTSFRRWALTLASQAASGTFAPQAEYWLTAAAVLTPLPRVAPQAAAPTVATARTVEVALSAEETHQFLQELPANNTQVIEVLLTALLKAFSSWTGSHRLRIDLEGHGRESVEDLDLSRTLGWFTTLTPVVLELKRGGPGIALRAVKEQLQRIPHRGLSYGVLRYLGGDALAERLGALPDAEICFNYLGQLDTALPRGALFTPTFDLIGPTRSARQRLPYRLEINGSVLGGQLRMSWGYSTDLDQPVTVERLAGEFLGELRSLIAHCLQTGDGAFRASDFPDADLSARDLKKLMQKLFQDKQGLDS
ncbi:MAG TPA: amino acid adenylation domain-containing protein, partial [Thermoanaerobaculia bacterium]|nr:amino acid adenylation domain-containing protein [Thermoanaerobaculia bacterium]